MASENRTVFVTVGTTSFDKLISSIDSTKIKKILARKGFNKVICQIGQGLYEPVITDNNDDIQLEYYRMKPSIKEDIDKADLVICHAGAGSVLETLGAHKPCIVVINEDLMGNHQIELAKQLSEENYLFYSTCGSLHDTLEAADLSKLKQFPEGNPQLFVDFLSGII